MLVQLKINYGFTLNSVTKWDANYKYSLKCTLLID